MLTHKHRFHGHGSLRHVFSKSRGVRSRHLMLRYLPNPHRVHSRFAVIVSKKVHKRAVHRNRTRRRVFEIIREQADAIKDPFDVTITVFSGEVATLPHQKLKEEVAGLLRQAGIIS